MQTLPTCQRCFGDFLQPADSMHLQVITHGQPILVTSSLASEVIPHPLASPFGVQIFHLQLAVTFQIPSSWVWVP